MSQPNQPAPNDLTSGTPPQEGSIDTAPDKLAQKNNAPHEGGSAQQERSPQMRRLGAIKRQYADTTQQRAKNLRKNATEAERLLWRYLRKRQLGGHKFRRQQPIGKYIANFACMSQKVIVELDGGQHGQQADYDQERSRFLQQAGFKVLRFWDHDVIEDVSAVLEEIYGSLEG